MDLSLPSRLGGCSEQDHTAARAQTLYTSDIYIQYIHARRPAWGLGVSVCKLLVCSGAPSIREEGGRAGSRAPSCVASVVMRVGGSPACRGASSGTVALEASGRAVPPPQVPEPESPRAAGDSFLSRGLWGAPPSPAFPLPPCQDLKKYGATTVVRVCEVTYDKAPLEKDGITVVVRAVCGGVGGVWAPGGEAGVCGLAACPATPPVCVQAASLEPRRGPGLLSVPPRPAFGALSPGSECLLGAGLGAPVESLGRLSRGRGEGPLGWFPWSPILGTGGQAAGPVGWATWWAPSQATVVRGAEALGRRGLPLPR